MKMQRVQLPPPSELESLGEEIRKLREPARHLRMPEDLKIRICRLHKAGATSAQIRRATGVQPVSLKTWMKKCAPAVLSRPFRVVTVQENVAAVPPVKMLTFRLAAGKVTVEVATSELTPELMRILTSC